MGRSVSTPGDAVEVLYLDWMPDEEDIKDTLEGRLREGEADFDCDHDRQSYIDNLLIQDEWDYVIEDLRLNVLGDLFPSVTEADRWLGNEDHVIAENELAEFGISEYCGLAAIWVRVKEPREYYLGDKDTTGLALHWIGQAWPKVEARYPHRLGLMGRFSNGEAVYQRTERTET